MKCMDIKGKIKRALNYILKPRGVVNVNISQIHYGEILKNRCIVITGGGSGLGYYMAKKFISEGAKVLIVGRDEKKLKNAQSSLGKNCIFLSYDDFLNKGEIIHV